jgi:hypothetical protein
LTLNQKAFFGAQGLSICEWRDGRRLFLGSLSFCFLNFF